MNFQLWLSNYLVRTLSRVCPDAVNLYLRLRLRDHTGERRPTKSSRMPTSMKTLSIFYILPSSEIPNPGCTEGNNMDEQHLGLNEDPPSRRTRSKASSPELDFRFLASSIAFYETERLSEHALRDATWRKVDLPLVASDVCEEIPG